jgi:DNA-binding NtrC family response regulator
MQNVYRLIQRVAPTDATVLITGESGTGKEIVAETIHDRGPRRASIFLPLNCGAISPTLVENELFGHERGSFTGAHETMKGYFERADGGTLFLDEITEMSPELQVKLLRVLETGQVTRVGGDGAIPVDVRVIGATNRDPEAAVKEGMLREDIYYRLNVFPIALPPLRDREGDILRLAQHFLEECNRQMGGEKRWAREALARMSRHAWPGNVRELKNFVHRACILADEVIGPGDLPDSVPEAAPAPRAPHLTVSVGTPVAEAERRLILATLEACNGDKKAAARILGMSIKTLYSRLKVYKAREQPSSGMPGSSG